MRVRILPTDDFAEFGKTDRVALLLTIGRDEAYEILTDLDILTSGDRPVELERPTRKLYELMEAIASVHGLNRQLAFDIFNTEGRVSPPKAIP